jgi:hypothetical protein
MNNVLQMKPMSQTMTPTAPAAEADEPFDYRNGTVAELEEIWDFGALNTPNDKYLVIVAKNIVYALAHKPELKEYGLTKAHIVQAAIQVLVESTKEMHDAMTTGDQNTDPYLLEISKVTI